VDDKTKAASDDAKEAHDICVRQQFNRLPIREGMNAANESFRLGVSEENLLKSFQEPKTQQRTAIWNVFGDSADGNNGEGAQEMENGASDDETAVEVERGSKPLQSHGGRRLNESNAYHKVQSHMQIN
jgi:hypothetical protein